MTARTIAYIYNMLEKEYERAEAERDSQSDIYSNVRVPAEYGSTEEMEAAKKMLSDVKAKYMAAENTFTEIRDVFRDFDHQDWHFTPEG